MESAESEIIFICICFVQVWDRRHGDHPLKKIPCHSGPVYCCIWHPESENVVLTAGRDKMIKVAVCISHIEMTRLSQGCHKVATMALWQPCGNLVSSKLETTLHLKLSQPVCDKVVTGL